MSLSDDPQTNELTLKLAERRRLLKNRIEHSQSSRNIQMILNQKQDHPFAMTDSQAAKYLGLARLDKE